MWHIALFSPLAALPVVNAVVVLPWATQMLSFQQTSVAPATPATELAPDQQHPITRQLPPEVLATLPESYFATAPRLQAHLVGHPVQLPKGFPTNKPWPGWQSLLASKTPSWRHPKLELH